MPLSKSNQSHKEEKSEELFKRASFMTPIRIKTIRAFYNLTQLAFADLCGISYDTYRNWEIGHRSPCTPAVSLLLLAEENPKLFLKEAAAKKSNMNIASLS